MDRIASFSIDHTKLFPGLYVSREDKIGNESYTTYDVRFTRPNFEPVMTTAECHTLEHLVATWIRNKYPDRVIYVGPMGCRTGMYIIFTGARNPKEMRDILVECMKWLIKYDGEIPGSTKYECGNYSDQDLEGAKRRAQRYLGVLLTDDKCNGCY